MKISAWAALTAVLFSISVSAAHAVGNAGAGRGDVPAQFQRQEQRFAGGRTGLGGEVYLPPKGRRMFAGGRGGMSGDLGNGRTAAVTDTHLMLASIKPGQGASRSSPASNRNL